MTTSPFKFLDSCGKEDDTTFFGRGPETDELYARCTHGQTLVIHDRSGRGRPPWCGGAVESSTIRMYSPRTWNCAKNIRQGKIYGEFWKHIDTETLFKEE